jgi:DegV family protein with EDD domain
MYSLFVDSDSDMTPSICKKYGAHLIIMPYTINNKEIRPYVDFDKFNGKEFYDILRKGTLPVTAALPPQAYIDYFEPEFKKGNDILYVHFSSAMSGTFNSMRLALEELKEKYPERQLFTVDTKSITAGSYAIVIEILELYKQGKTIEEIQKWAEEEVEKFPIYFYADNLKFFAKSGRVSGFKAFMGGLVGIKPIIHVNSQGQMVSIDKGRGRQLALKKILDYVVKLQDRIEEHRVIIGHTDALGLAHEMADLLQKEFNNNLKIEFVEVNPTIGGHCGPDCIGVCFHGIHR